MKQRHLLVLLLLIAYLPLFCQQNVVFKGTVKCYIADDPRSTKGAKNVIVVPGFVPIKTGMTGPQGYYEVNTGIPLQKLEGKYVLMYFISSCKTCEAKRNVFVSEDQMKVDEKKNLAGLTLETMMMAAGCKNTELKPLQSDSIYNSFVKLPSQDLDKIAALNVVTATPGFLNLLTTLATVGAVGGGGTHRADTLSFYPAKIKYSQFLLASPMSLSSTTGFNFAPSRDLSEAEFWNPSALANSYHLGGVYVSSNFKNNHKVSAFAKINEQFTLGLGGIYTKQDEFRLTDYQGVSNTALHMRTLKEYAAYLSPVYQINKKVSVAVTGKSIWQTFNGPATITIVNSSPNPVNTFTDSTVNLQKFDADVSVSYKISPAVQVGLNAMNLAGTALYADALPVQKKVVPVQNLRSFGAGFCYKWKQFNFGTDLLFTQKDLYDVSVGVNYVPFNNALISGGFAFKQKSFSLAYRMKYFKLGYINDNSFLINEKNKAKSSIFNGYIYSGLSVEF